MTLRCRGVTGAPHPERQRAQYPVTNPIIQPDPTLFPLFFLKGHLLHQLPEYLNCIMSADPSQPGVLYWEGLGLSLPLNN